MLKMLLIITTLSATLSIHAQERLKPTWGIKGGLSIASISRELTSMGSANFGETSSTVRLKIGGYLQIPLSARLIFQPEAMMTGKGYDETGGPYPQTNRYSFLEFPLHLLYVWPGKRGSFMLGGGPSPTFKTSELYFFFPVRDFDMCADLLAVYQTPLGFSLQLNYTHGFSNIAYADEYVKEIKTRCWGITIGYVF